jgi:hypothetical protein
MGGKIKNTLDFLDKKDLVLFFDFITKPKNTFCFDFFIRIIFFINVRVHLSEHNIL